VFSYTLRRSQLVYIEVAMSKLLRLELWLFAIPVLVAVAAVLAGADRISLAGRVIPYLAGVWMILAIAWMLKTIFRRTGEE
jgi:drug/metabolite transporter superfamily protein YnfA